MGSETSNNAPSLKKNPAVMRKIKEECNRISAACAKNEDLERLQLKLSIFELKTFKKIKYDSKCAHPHCKNKAPKDFPSSDLYICPEHSRQFGIDCNQKLSVFYKKMESHAHTPTTEEGKMNDETHFTTGTTQKKSNADALRKVMQIPNDFIQSLMDGSINDRAEYPKYYWSLLMTKMLTILQYEKQRSRQRLKITSCHDDQTIIPTLPRIQLINNILKLLVLFRYVMNPMGGELLKLITEMMANVDSIGIGLEALNGIIATILGIFAAMYAVGFIGGVALVLGLVNDPNSIGQVIAMIAAGTVLVTAGGIVCAVTTGIGTLASAPLFGSGIGFLFKAYNGNANNNNGNNGQPVADVAMNQIAQQTVDIVAALQNENRIEVLRQQRAQLEAN